MGRKRATSFDPKTFLAIVDGGKNILKCRKKQALFSPRGNRGCCIPEQLSNSGETRLVRILLLVVHFMKENMVEELFFPKISQETLAGIAGTTRSRVSGFLMMLRQLGVIDDNDGSHIRSSLRNIALFV